MMITKIHCLKERKGMHVIHESKDEISKLTFKRHNNGKVTHLNLTMSRNIP